MFQTEGGAVGSALDGKRCFGPSIYSRLFGGLFAFGIWVAVSKPETLVFVRASRTCNPPMKLPTKSLWDK